MTDNEPTGGELANPDVTSNERRPVVNDQEPTGAQGISSDKPGVDPGGYPSPRQLPDAAEATKNDDAATEEDDT